MDSIYLYNYMVQYQNNIYDK